MSKRILIVIAVAALFANAAWSAMAEKEPPAAVDAVRAKIARDVFVQMMARWKNYEANDIEDLELWSKHILEADLDAAAGAEQRVAAYEEQIKRTAELATIAKSFAKTGQGLESVALAAEYYRLEAMSQAAKGR
jgi:hypothetical protein